MRTEDGTIIQKCLNGESEAFGILVDKYKAGIFAYVWHKLGNFHDAEEVTQEVFIKAFKHLRTLKRWDSFAVWLYSIAHELCRKWFRSQLRRPDHDLIEDQNIEELKKSDAVDSYKEDRMYDSLHDALDSLPKIYQEVLTLHYFGGLTGEEIAKVMCISHSAVRQRLSRAREQLKEEMVAMMSETFKEHRLQANFTFRIVEIIKKIKIHPMSAEKGIPWGISLAVGIILTVFSIGSNIMLPQDIGAPVSFALPSESKIMNIGEIPVDVVKTSNIASLLNPKGKGGESKQPDMQNAFMASQAEGGTWVKKSDMPAGLGYYGMSVVNGKIYIIGGYGIINGVEIPLSTVYEYDLKADKWSKKADMPTPRGYLGVCAANGKIYAIGGWDMTKNFSVVEEYDPIADRWEKKSDFPTKIATFTTSYANGKIYVIGGQDSGPAFNTVFEYDPKADTWIRKADMSTGKAYLTSCVFNNKIYVFGGANDAPVTTLLTTMEIYDPTTDTWLKGSDMPTARVITASCAIDGLIYIMGGWDKTKNFSLVEIYDPKNDKWSKGVDMPAAEHGIRLYPDEAKGKIYSFGGYGGGEHVYNYTSDVWEFTLEDLQSAISSKDKLPTKWGNIKK